MSERTITIEVTLDFGDDRPPDDDTLREQLRAVLEGTTVGVAVIDRVYMQDL